MRRGVEGASASATGAVRSSPAPGDVNGDGALDCVVGSYDKKVYVFTPGLACYRLATRDPLLRLADLRHERCWRALAEVASKTATAEADAWSRSLACRDLGIAHAWLGQAKDALDAARKELDARMNTGAGDHARWQGYLALIAHALGEKDAFPRLYAAYLDQPRLPRRAPLQPRL